MQRTLTWTACFIVFMFAGSVQAQGQFSIRAASAVPVEGWQRMQFEDSNRAVWIAPTLAVVASDIERAQPETTADGRTSISVVFTDAGAKKIHDLTTLQRKKLIALVVGDKLIWAPVVQQPQDGREGILTGNGPNGLTPAEVERIIASLR